MNTSKMSLWQIKFLYVNGCWFQIKIYAYLRNADHENQCCFTQIYVLITLITFSDLSFTKI